MPEPLLELQSVTQIFKTRGGPAQVLDEVSLSLDEGQVLCLVGESGSGKTTTAKIAAGLLKPTAGSVRYRGGDIWRLAGRQFADYRRGVQYIHQDPYASLNPVHSVFSILAAPLYQHNLAKGKQQALRRAAELLEKVDLTPAENFIFKYPHQLSGGQRQRVSVARALTLNPRLIVADEATSMLDVSIRVSMLNMLRRLRDDLGVSVVLITHDLAIAKYFAWDGSIAVMYTGRVVEYGATPRVINDPLHPYAKALLAAIPEADPDLTRTKREFGLRSLELPSLVSLPPGCSFHPRCPYWEPGLCDVVKPELAPVREGRLAACHVVARERTGEIAKVGAPAGDAAMKS